MNSMPFGQLESFLKILIGIQYENRATHATMAAMTQNATRHTTVITEQTPEARV